MELVDCRSQLTDGQSMKLSPSATDSVEEKLQQTSAVSSPSYSKADGFFNDAELQEIFEWVIVVEHLLVVLNSLFSHLMQNCAY